MRDNILFNGVFLAQILLISFYLPGRLLNQMKFVKANYLPESYPKLYPVSVGKIDGVLAVFRNMNAIILIIGFAILLNNIYFQHEELLNWDTQGVLTAYYLLQMTPLLVMEFLGFKYFRLMKEANRKTTRTANLQSRNLFDFVSPFLVGFAALTFLVFIGLVQYIKLDPFKGFGGDLNILILVLVNLFFGVLVFRSIYGKKRNPHQDHEDRIQGIKTTVNLMLIISIAVTAYAGLNLALHGLGLEKYLPVMLCLYYQFITILSYKVYRIGSTNFDVYKGDLRAT